MTKDHHPSQVENKVKDVEWWDRKNDVARDAGIPAGTNADVPDWATEKVDSSDLLDEKGGRVPPAKGAE